MCWIWHQQTVMLPLRCWKKNWNATFDIDLIASREIAGQSSH